MLPHLIQPQLQRLHVVHIPQAGADGARRRHQLQQGGQRRSHRSLAVACDRWHRRHRRQPACPLLCQWSRSHLAALEFGGNLLVGDVVLQQHRKRGMREEEAVTMMSQSTSPPPPPATHLQQDDREGHCGARGALDRVGGQDQHDAAGGSETSHLQMEQQKRRTGGSGRRDSDGSRRLA